jgi:hypothetical protein
MNKNIIVRYAAPLFAATILIGCGAGTPSAGGDEGEPFDIVARGVMSGGSVKLSGVTYTPTSNAVIEIDDSPVAQSALADGMVVKLRGTVNADGVTGSATRIEAVNEARGFVTAVDTTADPQRFRVGGITVLVDDLTVLALGGLTVADLLDEYVEVHGERDHAERLRASRVETKTRVVNTDELRGVVQNLATGTPFTLNGITVNYGGAQFRPSGTLPTQLANGQRVEVRGSFLNDTTFTANVVKIESLHDDRFWAPAAGDAYQVAGIAANVPSPVLSSSTFTVDGRTVQLAAGTGLDDGTLEDLANNVPVRVDGTLSGSTLVADKLTFTRARVLTYGVIQSKDTGARTLSLLGKTVRIDDLTDQTAVSFDSLVQGDRVQARGYVDNNGNVLAQRLLLRTDTQQDIVQGVVTSKASRSFVVLGLTAQNPVSSAVFRDRNNNSVTFTEFLNLLIPLSSTESGTLVSVRGQFRAGVGGGTLDQIDLAEIEDDDQDTE